MDNNKTLALLQEWREILETQTAIIQERSKDDGYGGLVGILVDNDKLACQYQQLDHRKWVIKRALFGRHYIGA